MATDDISDVVDDIRLTTLLHHADSLMNGNKMNHVERLAIGTHIIASVIRNMPEPMQMKWLSFAIHAVCTQSASLNTAAFLRDQPAPLALKQTR